MRIILAGKKFINSVNIRCLIIIIDASYKVKENVRFTELRDKELPRNETVLES